jgi:nuclear pore complex protein Nup160
MATTTPAARKIAGTEVPIPGSDRVRWIELTVPSTPSPSPEGDSDPFVLVPPRAASGFHVVYSGDSQCYLAWYAGVASPSLTRAPLALGFLRN